MALSNSRRARPRRAKPRRSRATLIKVVSAVASLGLVGTLAVFAQGYDAQEVPPLEPSVWVTRDTGQYARVNTELAEIDTVRSVDDPSSVAQNGADATVFTQGFGRLWSVNTANPSNLLSSGDSSGATSVAVNTPGGTREVLSSGDYVAYLTDTGKVYVGPFPDGADALAPLLVDPFRDVQVEEGVDPPSYTASAVAVDNDGLVATYSPDEEAVRVYDTVKDEFVGDPRKVATPPKADARVELAIVGGTWVLSDPGEGRVWIEGRDKAIETGLGGEAVIQSSSPGDAVALADSDQLVSVDLDSASVTQVANGSGTPAVPTVVDGVLYAAWLSSSAGTLWSSDGGEVDLDVEADVLQDVDTITPVIRSNGTRAVLSETSSGMLWTIPDGQLIPVEQWSLDDDQQAEGTIEVDDVAEQEPPVAVGDTFGVRSGQLVNLPMLLNDHDPNKKDVLTIVPDSETSLSDAGFGSVSLVSNNQEGVVRVTAGAGSASFSYAVTDGVSVSPPALVTLTVVGDDVNTPPAWCPVEGCVQDWPTPGIVAGGTVTVPVMNSWVDPEGDLFVLADATADDLDAPVTVVATADGDVVIRHQDPNAHDETIIITVTVMDSRGATATRPLEVHVTANPTLVAEPIAAVAGVGEKETIDVRDHVRGGSGSYRIVDAVQTTANDSLVVVPNVAAGQIDFSASKAGDYVVTYTVQDTVSLAQQSAVLRISAVRSGSPLAIAPLTAFVRANEDATVDVIGAVQNTSGRVLLVSQAATSDAGLSISVVGQSQVRVSGSTADGKAGRIGTASVTVTDGAGNTVVGQLTVFLVPSAIGLGPIAVPDAVTVRAGQQVDIPVARNDVTPRGERLVVHPQIEGWGAAGELAFVAGDIVRYLAPSAPGVYTLRYSAYLENEPDRLDATTITVTVIPGGSNRPPQPPILTARVLAGQSVAIPFDGFGVDPDGDQVFLTGVDQPDAGAGVAEISAEGDVIIYTAPGDGVNGGQLSFGYTIRDAEGASVGGIVRVGVLDANLSDTAPVTYSDYVAVQGGATTPLTIEPMLNDRDPAQGSLSIQSLVPNAAPGSPEFERLSALIDDSTDIDKGVLSLRAGDALGVHSYIYTVISDRSFSTAEGLVVVNVTNGQAPDVPLITDTTVTAKNRSELADGIDVVTDKVQWATGDVAKLKLELWGSAADRYTVSGRSISGSLPDDGDTVPFSLTGIGGDGKKVVSYGFLWIPPFDDMRVQLRSGVKPIEVGEENSIEFAIRNLLDLDAADKIEIRDDAKFAVQRDNASCTRVSGSKVSYDAGREAPWTDTCTVPVRIDGQKTWTLLGVPIAILPKDPQAILNALSRTVPPGGHEVIDLYADMTTWEGGREGDTSLLDYTTVYRGTSFTVTQTGSTVTIDTDADARPGTRETIQVSVSNFGGLTSGISLVVGVAPPDAPRGATFGQQCDVSKGASCSITVTPHAGEYDPFAGKVGSGLKLVSVGTGGSVVCPVATVTAANESAIVATWPAGPKPSGGECVVPYTVADAQGRTGSGTVTIDVLGYPQKPATVTTVAYTGTSVTLSVPLGDATQAHPSVTGVNIYEGGSLVNTACAPGGPGEYRCTVTGLVNGQKHTYTARAVNSVGESLDTTGHITSAYQKPVIDNLTADAVYRPGVTAQNVGVVSISITAADDAQSYRITEGGVSTTITRTGTVTTADLKLAPGNRVVEVVPISRFQPPIGNGNEGDARTINVQPAGTPYFTSNGSATPTANSITLAGATVNANFSVKPLQQVWVAWLQGSATPACTANGDGSMNSSGGVQSGSPTIAGLQENQDYLVASCASNGFGAVMSGAIAQFTFNPQSPPTGTLTYTVNTNYSGGGNHFTYDLASGPSIAAADKPNFSVYYIIDGNKTTNFNISANSIPSITALYCFNGHNDRCSPGVGITPAGPPTTVDVRFSGSCQAEGVAGVTISGPAQSSAAVVVGPPSGVIFQQQTVTITWSGAFAGLQTITHDVDVCPF